MEPLDYASPLARAQTLVPDLARRDLERRLGMLQIQRGEAEIAQEQAKAAEQSAFKTDLLGLGENPTPDKLRMVATRYPAFAKNLSDLAGGIEEAQRKQTVGHLAQVQAALSNKRPDLARALVQRHIDADKAAGREPDENDTELVSLIDSGNPDAVRLANATVYGLLAAANPDTAAKNITEQSGDFTLGPGAKRFSADGTVVAEAPFAPQYRSVGEGDTLVEVGGEGGGQASGGTGGGGGSGAPRSVRNNNPGNLKASAFTRKLPGFAGVDDGGFAIFDSPQSGAGAQASLLSNYIDRGFNTVGKIINRWAPPSDNNDTGAYVRTVSQALGVKPGEVIGKDKIPALQSIIARVEGGPGSSNAGTGAAGGARVIAQGAPKKGYRILSAGEVSQIPGLDPQTVYQQGPDGNITMVGGQSKAQLKPWPANALAARKDIVAAAKNIDTALSLFDPKNKSPKSKRAKAAVGFGTGAFGESFTQWNDPDGVEARAVVGQIGGIIIKDTSGAAVSLSEDKRLAKWVPLVTDTPSAVHVKLQNLRRELRQRAQAMDETYTEDQGFRPLSKSQPSGGFKILRVRPK